MFFVLFLVELQSLVNEITLYYDYDNCKDGDLLKKSCFTFKNSYIKFRITRQNLKNKDKWILLVYRIYLFFFHWRRLGLQPLILKANYYKLLLINHYTSKGQNEEEIAYIR